MTLINYQPQFVQPLTSPGLPALPQAGIQLNKYFPASQPKAGMSVPILKPGIGLNSTSKKESNSNIGFTSSNNVSMQISGKSEQLSGLSIPIVEPIPFED